jgi:hypothetical protein
MKQNLETKEMSQGHPALGRETENMKERRVHERKDVRWVARIMLSDVSLNCIVLDLSLGGARVGVGDRFQGHQRVQLELEKIASLNAEVVWRGIGIIGLRFTNDPVFIERTLGPFLR